MLPPGKQPQPGIPRDLPEFNRIYLVAGNLFIQFPAPPRPPRISPSTSMYGAILTAMIHSIELER